MTCLRVLISRAPLPPFWARALVFAPVFFLTVPLFLTAPAFTRAVSY